jgi:RNA polymerase sigma-70 factor, ECF subfamily
MERQRKIAEMTRDELHKLRKYMLRCAMAELRDLDEAEEMVQQALEAALEAEAGFQGQSTLKTWLVSILRHKIIDHRRRRARSPIVDTMGQQEVDSNHDEVVDFLCAVRGGYTPCVQSWSDPVKALESRRFWDALEAGLRTLPAAGARAFCLTELNLSDTSAICDELGVSTGNYWVILHRARLGLRSALGTWGFGDHAEQVR